MSPTIQLLLLLSIFYVSNCYKLLVFSPATSKSHLISNGRLADELARAGHDVVLLELDFLEITDTTKTAKIAKRQIVKGFKKTGPFKDVLNEMSKHVMSDPTAWQELSGLYTYGKAYNDLCEDFLTHDSVFEELKAQNFDGFFAEQINLCGFGYAYALGIQRRFMISSCPFAAPVYDFTGLPMPFATVPFATDLSPNPSIMERGRNIFASIASTIGFRILDSNLVQIFQDKFGSEFPRPTEIARNVDIIFIATDEVIDFSAPTLQNIVNVGGLGVDDDVVEMDEVFTKEMNKGKNGVIFFSLGTIANTSSIDNKVMESFLEIVKKFDDYHFLIRADKYDKNTRQAAAGIANVFISDWLPQPAILHHPRLKTFITHAGYNGLIEAARAGVPLITIPFMFDQNMNSRAVEKKGWGIRRNKQQLLTHPEEIESAIREMLSTDKYTKQAHRIRDLIRTKPLNSRERLIKTTEWVIANDGVHELQSESRNLSIITFYSLDIFLPIFAFIFFFIIPKILGWYYFSCFGHIESKKKSKIE